MKSRTKSNNQGQKLTPSPEAQCSLGQTLSGPGNEHQPWIPLTRHQNSAICNGLPRRSVTALQPAVLDKHTLSLKWVPGLIKIRFHLSHSLIVQELGSRPKTSPTSKGDWVNGMRSLSNLLSAKRHFPSSPNSKMSSSIVGIAKKHQLQRGLKCDFKESPSLCTGIFPWGYLPSYRLARSAECTSRSNKERNRKKSDPPLNSLAPTY